MIKLTTETLGTQHVLVNTVNCFASHISLTLLLKAASEENNENKSIQIVFIFKMLTCSNKNIQYFINKNSTPYNWNRKSMAWFLFVCDFLTWQWKQGRSWSGCQFQLKELHFKCFHRPTWSSLVIWLFLIHFQQCLLQLCVCSFECNYLEILWKIWLTFPFSRPLSNAFSKNLIAGA